jgi:hypothetical protein
VVLIVDADQPVPCHAYREQDGRKAEERRKKRRQRLVAVAARTSFSVPIAGHGTMMGVE